MKTKTARTTIPHGNPSRRRGFTLVEVLVTISIIAVMALLLVVMTRRIKSSAMQANAVNTIRQVSAACVAYSTEKNGDILVLLDGAEPRTEKGYITKNFWGQLTPFLFSDVTVRDDKATSDAIKQRLNSLFSTSDCSKMTGTFQQGALAYGDVSGIRVPFSFSTNVYDWFSYLKTGQYSDPGRVLYMAYGGYRFNAQDGESYSPIAKIGQKRVNNIDYFENRTAAFNFLDGHVEILSPPIPTRLFGTKPPK